MEPIRIEPEIFYHDGDVRLKLGVTSHALAIARRSGKLKFVRKGRALLYRGEWLLVWLTGSVAVLSEGDADE